MAIEVAGLVHEYGDLRALDGVSFRVAEGEVFGCLGPNGAGKSTTVQILLGLLCPTAGRVLVAGIDVAEDPVAARAKIGYLPEVLCLYEALTPEEHVRFAGRLRGLEDAVIERRQRALFSAFDLAERAREPIRTLSKGMRQKVALALAFVHRPPVLLLDEPLAGLDATAALVLKDLIRGFAARGASILYCSHVLDVVERVCDRALILNRGRTAAAGTIEELRARTAGTTLEEVFRSLAAERDPTALAAEVLEVLDS
ncbi:MAG: ABC transporter ATP-binding protein [Planctomycetes bacterium]|nr:ABC transporter ATP-binding protein [Planctomycetota bacterium]